MRGRLRAVLLVTTTIALLAGLQVPAHGSTTITSNVSVNTQWTLAGSPYIVTMTTFKVLSGATLTIDPGVTVQFNNGSWTGKMVVEGRLNAVGTSTSQISFTSGADSAPGQWYFMWFVDSSTGTLDYVDIRNSGGLESGTPWALGAFRMESTGLVTIGHARIHDNNNSGILAASTASLSVQDSLIEANDIGVSIVGGSGGGGVAQITDSTIQLNGKGVFINHSLPAAARSNITYSNIMYNDDFGIQIQEAASNPISKFPAGTNNNILSNNPDPLGSTTTTQLYVLNSRPDAAPLWDGNFWGATASGPIPCPFAPPVWQLHVFYYDDLSYPQDGPINSSAYTNPDNTNQKCAADRLAVESIA